MLDQSATTIQRHWRGFMAREFARSHLIDQVTKMWWEHYHRCATKIQALWRGHKARKNGVSFPKYRRWLQSVYDKNTETSTRMKEFRDSESAYMRKLMERESMLWILFILFKLHHLLSTESQPGVLAHIDKTRFTMIEKMMRSLEYTLYVEKRRLKKCRVRPPDAQPLLFEGTYFERCEKEIRDLERSLELGNGSIRRGECVLLYLKTSVSQVLKTSDTRRHIL
ncbi:spermatogenesis-associated protein 17-like [Neodiprion fabricii]|uniref:spermatogenesis-associated protein 17-like n=1 Tax=Neodiprion fabricii TaxID=2872261 RepID=UPI001ED8C975|nr:spermatogenesis-associated protein 17-like [Neodiprion fabricii]